MTPKDKWLRNAEAAEALAVSERTIKGWTKRKETREALGAVQCRTQWRIPRPENPYAWEFQTRARLKKLGICPPKAWERELEMLAKRCGRYLLESYRLWLAAHLKVLERGRTAQEARDNIDFLRNAASDILERLPRYEMEVDKLKSKLPAQLLARGFSDAEVQAAMGYWPEAEHFRKVRAAHTLDKLEAIRQTVDFLQATRELEQDGQKPTAKNIRPLLHKDFTAHINDTREQLPPSTIKVQRPEDLRRVIEADVHNQLHGSNPRRIRHSVDAQGKTYATVEGGGISCLDLRQPQDGLPLRTFRRRHPRKQEPQRTIMNVVCDVRDSIPGADERPHTGKTPARGH